MAQNDGQGAVPAGLMGSGDKARRQRAAEFGANEISDALSTLGTADASTGSARIGQNDQRTTADLQGEYRPQ